MICLSVDPGQTNVAVIVVLVNKLKQTIEILHSSIILHPSDCLVSFYSTLYREIGLLYDLYDVELTTIENQQKATNRKYYKHNLFNTNAQAIVYTMAKLKNSAIYFVSPQQWHKLLLGKKKGIRMHRIL